MKKTKSSTTIHTRKKLILIIAIGAAIAAAMVTAYLYAAPIITNNARKERITAIYDSFHIDASNYLLQQETIFGEKKPYPNDGGRSQSSSKHYIRAANVDVTVAELKKAITSAGFTYFETPYPGSAFTELHFKSAKNEYVRLNVSSKPRNDTLQNKLLMGIAPTNDDYSMNFNAGPSSVILKVNLDDNNE